MLLIFHIPEVIKEFVTYFSVKDYYRDISTNNLLTGGITSLIALLVLIFNDNVATFIMKSTPLGKIRVLMNPASPLINF